jgi:hypothetical protein
MHNLDGLLFGFGFFTAAIPFVLVASMIERS